MPTINVTLTISDSDRNREIPLQRNFVEHLVAGVRAGLYITDNDGRVCDRDGNLGIFSWGSTVDIRVLLQNSVVKHQDLLSWKDFTVKNGQTERIRSRSTHIDKFRVVNHCVKVYDTVFRQFEIFNTVSRGDFPLGSRGSLEERQRRPERIELDFPSAFPFAIRSFTEPKAITTGYPILHILSNDDHLFGRNGKSRTLVASELAHALHFSFISVEKRDTIQNQYLTWLLGQTATGASPLHDLNVSTTPMVAFLEALDHFSSRFFKFVLNNPNDIINAHFRNNFIRSELAAVNNDGSPVFCNFSGGLNNGSVLQPSFTGTSIEGAIYAAIFLDFARQPGVGLKKAVNSYFRSNAISFGEYFTWIGANKPELLAALKRVKATWLL